MGRKYSVETFELCKRLYELKPDWQGVTDCNRLIKLKAPKSHIYPEDVNQPCYDWAPEYTLEYLLDKLPKTIDGDSGFGTLALSTRQGQYRNGWLALYEDNEGFAIEDGLECAAQNPLHAVLKLAIAVTEMERKGIQNEGR